MVVLTSDLPAAAPPDAVDEDQRSAAVARLSDLFSAGELSLERFSEALDQVFAAPGHAGLEAALSALPAPVRLTPPPRRLDGPLVLDVADGGLQMGAGWQLGADTTIITGAGSARLDLTVASWDARDVSLRLETWGSIEVLVPEGTAVQLVGGSAHVQLASLSPPVPGGPVLRISTSGPTGVIRIRHPGERNDGLFGHRGHRRRRQTGGGTRSGR
jgi:hypothetical protein